MKRYIIMLLFFPITGFAQQLQTSNNSSQSYSITGKVVDEHKEGLPNANVLLRLPKDSTIISSAVTDIAGAFKLSPVKPGGCFLEIGYVSYNTLAKDISVGAADLDLGLLELVPNKNMLGEVVITAAKPLIERRLDRFVVNVEGRPAFVGSSAFDVIKTAPGVYVSSNDNINIMGKSGVMVMLDGRLLHMSADELKNMLKNMSADNIKSLEVITVPSSKYDAEGNAGILNIVTKKNSLKGWNASTSITGYKGKYGRLIGNGTYNYKNDRFDLATSYTIGQVNSFEKIKLYNNIKSLSDGSLTRINSRNYERRKEFYNSFNGQLDVKLSESSTIGIAGNLFADQSPRPAENTTSIQHNSATDSSFTTANDYLLNLFNCAVDGYYNYKIDTLGKAMNLDLSIANYKRDDDQNFTNIFFADTRQYDEQRLRSSFSNNIFIEAAKVDFTLPYEKFRLETGAKITHITADNDFLFENFLQDEWTNNPSLSNKFKYDETNTAAYVSFSKELSDKLSLQFGLRGEYTLTKGFSETLNQMTLYNYFQLFPTAYFQYKPQDNYQLNVSYSKRISRPSYDYLNPFISYQSPLFSHEGNPLLRPSFTHSVEITNIIHSKYSFTLFSNRTNQFFSEFPTRIDNTEETRYTFDNIGTSFNYGVQLIAPITVTSWWNISNTALVMQQHYSLAYNELNQDLNRFFWLYNISNTFHINHHINAEISGSYNSPSLQGFYRVGNSANLNVGITAKFWDENATLGIGVSDLLYTNRSIVRVDYPNQALGFTRYNDTRLLKLSFKYRFGNNLLKSKQRVKSGSAEEQNRAN